MKYYLTFYPNDNEHRGTTWIGLHMDFERTKKVECEWTIKIESANYSQKCQYVYEKSQGRGRRICKTEEFFDPKMKFIADRKITVKVIGFFKFDASINIVVQQQKCDCRTFLNELWEQNETKDFTIVVGSKEIMVHKCVLFSRSDVFRAMLKPHTKESAENKVVLKEVPFEIVETAVKMMHEYNCDTALSTDDLMSLLQFFDIYNLTQPKAKIELLLIDRICPSTVCRLANHSVLTNSSDLKEKCIEFLAVAFTTKSSLNDFEALDKDFGTAFVKDSFYQILGTE
uniref:BTB domain-containing protein n=1 Tax=Panagrolaimus davidi TaxID=227884 RepID=A0A914PCA2_9BILA